MARTSESVTCAGAMPVAECTVVFYAFTNFGITSIYLRVLIRKVLVDLIFDCPVRPLHNRAIDVWILAHLKLCALSFQHCLKFAGQKYFALICSNPDGAAAASAVPRVPQNGFECRRHGSAGLDLQWDRVQILGKYVNDGQ